MVCSSAAPCIGEVGAGLRSREEDDPEGCRLVAVPWVIHEVLDANDHPGHCEGGRQAVGN